MIYYIFRRILFFVPTLFVPLIVVFLLMRIALGDPASFMIGETAVRPEQVERLYESFGLDKPILTQLGSWLWRFIHLDLGESIFWSKPVTQIISEQSSVHFLW